MQGALHTVFDFTSRVVDFISVSTSDELDDQDKIGERWVELVFWNELDS